MNRADVQMLQGAIERLGHSFLDSKMRERDDKRYAEQQILEQQMRERDDKRYEEQREFQKAFRDWQMKRGDEQWEAGARGRATGDERGELELELLKRQRAQPAASSGAPAPMFDIEGTIDPDTGARAFHSIKGKVPEEYVNQYMESLKPPSGGGGDLQPQPAGEQAAGLLKRIFGGLGGGAPEQGVVGGANALSDAYAKAVEAGRMTPQEAQEALAAKRQQALRGTY